MSTKSTHSFTEHSHIFKQVRGGDKKVMKKSISLVVTGALVTSVFASSAFAAELTTQEKFDALKQAGVLTGYPDGTAGLNKNITRAEFSKVLVLLNGLTPDAAAANYKDVAAKHWAKSFIGAGTKAGYLNGLGNNLFGPSQSLTVEQVAKTLVIAAGLQPKADAAVSGAVSAWAKGYVAAAIEAGLIDQAASYKVAATRGQVVEAAYGLSDAAVSVKSAVAVDASNIEVTFSDNQVVKQALTTPLEAGKETTVTVSYQGKSYEVKVTLEAVKAVEAAQSGAKTITVKFNRVLTATEKTYFDGSYSLKSNMANYPVTAKYADDNKSVVLTAAYLPVGDYTLAVKDSSPFNIKVAAAVATKLDVTVTALMYADSQNPSVKLYNQFNEEMTTGDVRVQAYNATQGGGFEAVDVSATNINLKAKLTNGKNTVIGDTININAVHPATGLIANKALKVLSGSSATAIKVDAVQPLKDETRISVNKSGYVLPVTLTDAAGQAIKLPQGTINFDGTGNATYAGLYFYSSDKDIIGSLNVDKDGKVTFATKAKPGNVVIGITNGVTGAAANTSINVQGASKLKEFQLGNPNEIVVQNEEVVFPFNAVDTFGVKIEGKDLDLNQLDLRGNLAFTKRINAKGELVIKFTEAGSAYLYVQVKDNYTSAPGSLPVRVELEKKIAAVNGIKDLPTTFEIGASKGITNDNIVLADNYGRTATAAAGTYELLALEDNSEGAFTLDTATGQLTALKAGTATVKVAPKGNLVSNAASYTFTVTAIESKDIKSYSLEKIGTVYGKAGDDSRYYAGVKLLGKTASGTAVELKAPQADMVITSTNDSVLQLVNGKLKGLKAGESTVSAFLNGKSVAEQKVTVSEDKPSTTKAEIKLSKDLIKVGAVATVTVKETDQYGVETTVPATGKLFSNESKYATVSGSSVTGVAQGVVTLTYVASNGVTATASLSVEN
ncbi:S-layer homology domain-containing protein [Paenibacillaceae bacterium GAS479]|nr:S-layer homology domain-containing protein [Paenibacillaceae bacterium GAS479]